jgi:hypothetical protein
LLDAFGFPFQKGADESALALPKRSSRGPVRRGGRSAKKK